ncbi:MAG: T9SS type A sorting domain-containing protein, partial [Bacteroidia bacterium]
SYTGVSASSTVPWSSFYGLVSIDSNSVAGYGGFSNRDASDMYNGIGYTQVVGSTNFADEAIYLAHKISTLGPGMSALMPAAPAGFKFASVFSAAAVPAAIAALGAPPITTSVKEIVNADNAVTVYPNPFTNNTTFSINKSVALLNAEIHIYDVVGKEVKTISAIQSHEFTIDRADLANGMYFYKLINKGQVIGSGKVIIK